MFKILTYEMSILTEIKHNQNNTTRNIQLFCPKTIVSQFTNVSQTYL